MILPSQLPGTVASALQHEVPRPRRSPGFNDASWVSGAGSIQ